MYLVFDIETVPDTVSGRRWLRLADDLEDRRVAEAMGEASSFLKPAFHRVVAIAAALVDEQGRLRRLGAIGAADDAEATLIEGFFGVIRDLKPTLVGWNTSGFDLPLSTHTLPCKRISRRGVYGRPQP